MCQRLQSRDKCGVGLQETMLVCSPQNRRLQDTSQSLEPKLQANSVGRNPNSPRIKVCRFGPRPESINILAWESPGLDAELHCLDDSKPSPCQKGPHHARSASYRGHFREKFTARYAPDMTVCWHLSIDSWKTARTGPTKTAKIGRSV